MSGVVVGFVPGPEGRAALDAGIAEARFRQVALIVVNSTRGDALIDDRFVQGAGADALQAELDALEITTELRQPRTGEDVAEALDAVAFEVDADLIVIGLRRRSTVGKLILGSAASRILLSVHHAVLTVKA